MVVQIQLRRDTAANWTSADPTLAEGELGVETDTGLFKFGDGATAWTGLSYSSATVTEILDIPTAETDTALVLAPDGTGGVEFRAETGGMTNPMTTAADLIVGDTGGTPARLAKGTDGQVLTVDPGTHLLAWATPGSGSSPLTTKGDLWGYDSADARVPIGSNGQVLTADSGEALGLKWATPSGGGGGAHPMPLDGYTIDGTYGDDFTGAALAGIWTRRNYTGGAETYQVGPFGTYLRIDATGRAKGDGYFQTAPSGDWTFAMKFIPRFMGNAVQDWGLVVIDSSGTGLGCWLYGGGPVTYLLGQVTTYSGYGGSFQSPGNQKTIFQVTSYVQERPVWMYIRKSGTNYYNAYSLDGELWSPESPAISSGITVDRIGMMHCPLGAETGNDSPSVTPIDVDWFNKIA